MGGESDSAFAERVADRNRYVAMCRKEKQIFAQTIGKTKSMLVKLANHNFVKKTVGEINDDLASTSARYGSMVKTYVDGGDSARPTASEQNVLKAASTGAIAQYKASTAYINKAKKEANIKKAMLLQYGQ
jgi:phage protein D